MENSFEISYKSQFRLPIFKLRTSLLSYSSQPTISTSILSKRTWVHPHTSTLCDASKLLNPHIFSPDPRTWFSQTYLLTSIFYSCISSSPTVYHFAKTTRTVCTCVIKLWWNHLHKNDRVSSVHILYVSNMFPSLEEDMIQ